MTTGADRLEGVKDRVVDDDVVTGEAVAAFFTASRALVGISVRSMAAAPVALTVPQHRVLVLVSADGGRRIGQLAEELGVNQSNASRVVDRLASQGLARRVPDPADRRATVAMLTPAGRRVLETVNEHRLRELRTLVARMSPRARALAAEALAEFNTVAHERHDPAVTSG